MIRSFFRDLSPPRLMMMLVTILTVAAVVMAHIIFGLDSALAVLVALIALVAVAAAIFGKPSRVRLANSLTARRDTRIAYSQGQVSIDAALQRRSKLGGLALPLRLPA